MLATDPKTGETKAKTVTATILGDGAKDLVKVTIRTTEATPSAVVAGDRDGSGGDQSPPTSTADHGDRGDRDGSDTSTTASIVATDGHPFWVPELGEWLDADELKSGQWLQTSSGTWVQITAIESWTQQATVHNLTVEGIHTYHALAGATPLLVHNCGELSYEEAAERANQALSAELDRMHATMSKSQIRRYAMGSAAVDRRTGMVEVGLKRTGDGSDFCAEDICRKALEARGARPENIVYSVPIRPLKRVAALVCRRCESRTTRDQFAPGTKWESDQG